MSFFGDGATGEGVFYESLNFASLKKLPLIFVCENNLYSTHLSIDECRPNRDIFSIGKPFDVLAMQVDGNDVLAVYENTLDAVAHCRDGTGPVLLECRTYRLRGHVGPDDNIQGTHTDIRPDHEIEAWKARDPIPLFAQELLANNILSEEAMASIIRDVNAEIADAYTSALNGPDPQISEFCQVLQ